MAWTSPRTWVTSELVTASIMNTHVRDNLNYLHAAPHVDVYRNGTQSVASGSDVKVQLNAEAYDDSGWFDSSTNYRLQPDEAIRMLVIASVTGDSIGDTTRIIAKIKNSGSSVLGTGYGQAASAGGSVTAVAFAVVDFNGSSDYVELYVNQNSGVNKDLIGSGRETHLTATRVAA